MSLAVVNLRWKLNKVFPTDLIINKKKAKILHKDISVRKTWDGTSLFK